MEFFLNKYSGKVCASHLPRSNYQRQVMEDTYVYVSVKLYLKPGADIQEVVQECDYSFKHEDIIEHEIMDILDTQAPTPTTKE